MLIDKKSLNKSLLAPLADRKSSQQLNFLLLNSRFTILVNNYKSNMFDLELLRILAKNSEGFTYHPNKNIKTRAFKGLNMVFSSDVLNGLVVFIFFKDPSKALSFVNVLKSQNINTMSYFSALMDGHITSLSQLSGNLSLIFNNTLVSGRLLHICNKISFGYLNITFCYPLNKIFLILNAYIKSTN